MRWSLATVLLSLSSLAPAIDLPHHNWENHPVHAIDLSPDGRRLAVAHTADRRVQWFTIGAHGPEPAGHVEVGIDPVSVRFRNADELWVVNHISDSISIVDPRSSRVLRTLQTGDEPFDVVFARGKAFVSCSQLNQIWVYDLAALDAAPRIIPIEAEDPRALAVSADGQTVAAAIFESGNGSTILGGGLMSQSPILAIPNVVSDPRGPYGGQNPPPNDGNEFEPPLNLQAAPPAVGLIVKRDAQGRWRDDNTGDWTDFVSGNLASASGRRIGWNLIDHDIALINADTLAVRYVDRLLNIGMAISARPDGGFALVGTDAHNQIRFEPNVRGRFIDVVLAQVAGNDSIRGLHDLNPHLRGQPIPADDSVRAQSIGDPRGLVWQADGSRGWVAGMGSNNVLEIDAAGQRVGSPIEVGEGPVGLIVDPARNALYVWNHFEASLSVVDLAARAESRRIAVFNPLPQAIRDGRRFFYDTRLTSGQGQLACASCHIDGRMDRLAWDLGDPAQPPQRFEQNCITERVTPCEDFHAMKGPMTTQTMQDIIGHEPHHWRGDRTGIEEFNPAFPGLLGRPAPLTDAEMRAFEDFLATLRFPPNPHRALDNGLRNQLALPGHFTSGRFATAGQPLPPGNPQRGLQLFTQGLLDAPFQCANCHTLPTGMAANGPMFLGTGGQIPAGGRVMPIGPKGENHLGIVSTDGSTNVSIKVAQLRNQHEKTGFELTQLNSRAGFGFLHDGSVDSLARFLSARVFSVGSDQDIADLVALNLSFAGSEFALSNPPLGAPAPVSLDSHAAVGKQMVVTGAAAGSDAEILRAEARAGSIDLLAEVAGRTHAYQTGNDLFLGDDGSTLLAWSALLELASTQTPLLLTAVPKGLGSRLGIDRDGDGLADAEEIRLGADPTDPNAKTLRAASGLWFNPARSGHGFDLQHAGGVMALTWYTYDDAGTPTWYQAVAARANPWTAELLSFRWNAASGRAESETAGSVTLSFADAEQAQFAWRLGNRQGSEPVQRLLKLDQAPAPDHTGIYFDPNESGWGISMVSGGDTRAALLYYYAGDGSARWTLGLGDNRLADERMPMDSYRGFCPDCPAVEPTISPAGFVDWRFDGARDAEVDIAVQHNAGDWQRSATRLVPLSDAYRDPRWR